MAYAIPGAFAVLAAIYLFLTSRIPLPPFGGPINARVFPTLVGIAILIAVGAWCLEIRQARQTRQSEKKSEADSPSFWADLPIFLGLAVGMGLYIATLDYLGYMISTAIFLFLGCYLFGGRRILLSTIVALIFSVGIYFLFTRVFHLVLPRGYVLPF